MNKKIIINKDTKAIVTCNGTVKHLKYVDERIVRECQSDIIKYFKMRGKKNAIYMIYKDNVFLFLESYFPTKKRMRDSAKILRKKGFIVWCYNG